MAKKLALLGGPKTVNRTPPAYPVIGKEEQFAVTQTLLSRQLSQVGHGGVVGQMEEAYADHFGAKYCHSFNSGTAAIASALFALGVGPGDEVLTAADTWISGLGAICHAGATPVFCDVKQDSHHIDSAEIRRKATKRTKAVVVTHVWGFPADMTPIMKAARARKLAVVEDCSHAHGGKYKGKYLGTIGDVGAFSLQGSKAIVAGEGGFLLTNNKLWYERSMIPGDHGARLRQELTHEALRGFAEGGGAWTYRIAPLCAAVAVEQLKRLNTLNAARQTNFERLHKTIKKHVPFIKWPALHKGSVRGWYGTPALYEYDQKKVSRDTFCEACAAEGAPVGGVGYANFYEIPLFQDTKLYGQMFTVKHAGGAEFTPVKPGSLKRHESVRRRNLVFPIPAEECGALMDQVGEAIAKVASNMSALAKYQKQKQ